jgi:hypothetical protein
VVSILAMSEPTRWENIPHLGTAALGCPAERSFAGLAGVEMNFNLDRTQCAGGGCPHVIF